MSVYLGPLLIAARSLQNCRFQSVLISKLVYEEYGDPVKVVRKCLEESSEKLQPNSVLVKMLAAPVNPADINTIQGKYPLKSKLPAVPGNEGVGEILEKGNSVTNFDIGDRVIPLTNMLGIWRSHIVLNSEEVLKVPKDLGLVEASTLKVNPCTAYRMLKDFVQLEKGDVWIQNGANSACGQNAIQLGRIWGLKSVNIVRNRENVDKLKGFLKGLGATEVLTEEELRSTDMFKLKILQRPKLALNCVGGKSAIELIRNLDRGGTMVTYGGMSREPVIISTSALIFKDVKVRGFWMSEWTKKNFESPQRKEMLDELVEYMMKKELQGPAYKMVNFDNFREALVNTMSIKGMIGLKYILNFKP